MLLLRATCATTCPPLLPTAEQLCPGTCCHEPWDLPPVCPPRWDPLSCSGPAAKRLSPPRLGYEDVAIASPQAGRGQQCQVPSPILAYPPMAPPFAFELPGPSPPSTMERCLCRASVVPKQRLRDGPGSTEQGHPRPPHRHRAAGPGTPQRSTGWVSWNAAF